MKFIPYELKNDKENMQIDSDLLDLAITEQFKEPIFRLYGWEPACVSLGRNQKSDFLNTSLLNKYGIDVVRRLTGGRALLHDDEITYSYICPVNFLEHGENITSSYKEISQILINALRKLGIETDFGTTKRPDTHFDYCMLISTGADLCYHGRKLIGSAQFRKDGYILQHGSILYDYNPVLLKEIFNEEVHGLTSIKEINPALTKEDIVEILSNVNSTKA